MLVLQPKLYLSVLLPEIIVPSVLAASPESRPTRILLPESFPVRVSDYRLHLRRPKLGDSLLVIIQCFGRVYQLRADRQAENLDFPAK